MQIIILGAGASHDYQLVGGSHKPPLTFHLVDEKYLDRDISKKYDGVEILLSNLINAVNGGSSFEDSLLAQLNRYGQKAHGIKQFIALSFYLRDLFEKFSKDFTAFNSYRTLINAITSSERETCVISFNYDTFFEQSSSFQWKSMKGYIKESFSLIKPHGSADWSYLCKLEGREPYFDSPKTPFEYLIANPNYIEDIIRTGAAPYHNEEIKWVGGREKLPALAVPLPNKQDFVCPPAHIRYLEGCLQKADRLLIIGWAGKDSHLLELMNKYLPPSIPITIVSGDVKQASDVETNLKRYLKGAHYRLSDKAGFRKFMETSEYYSFFE